MGYGVPTNRRPAKFFLPTNRRLSILPHDQPTEANARTTAWSVGIQRGLEKRRGLVRAAFVISGVSLLSAMGFGLRHVVPDWALTMPQMWMIHGSLNAFGFGLCGILAWRGAIMPAERP
jgi:hypothetical protein